MCGIYGYITDKPSEDDLFIFECLGVATEVRGKHATGYYGLNGKAVTEKLNVRATDFFNLPQFSKLYDNIPNILIGHNRYATHGKPEVNVNNHPFTNDRFGFIHNGVVYEDVKDEIENACISQCDSERIFQLFNYKFNQSKKIVKSIANSVRHFDTGSMACMMVDSQNRQLYLFRNIGNPIHLFKIKGSDTLFFSSTKEIAKRVIDELELKFSFSEEMAPGIKVIDEVLKIDTYPINNLRKEKFYKLPTMFEVKSSGKKVKGIKSNITGKIRENKHSSIYPKCPHCEKHFMDDSFVRDHIEKVHTLSKWLDDDEVETMVKKTNLTTNWNKWEEDQYWEEYKKLDDYKKQNDWEQII
jgi:uncharacterized C2H2 Zn-finger protein